MVCGAAHGKQVDVVHLAARAWAPVLVTLSKDLTLAITHRDRNGAVVSHGDKSQPSQNGGEGDYVDDRIRLRPIQLLCFALASLPPPSRFNPTDQNVYSK